MLECNLFGFVCCSGRAFYGWVPVIDDLGHKYHIDHKRHDICCNDCNVASFLYWSEYSRQSSTKQQCNCDCRQLACTGITVVGHYLYKLHKHNNDCITSNDCMLLMNRTRLRNLSICFKGSVKNYMSHCLSTEYTCTRYFRYAVWETITW